jgi:hypothetical protein
VPGRETALTGGENDQVDGTARVQGFQEKDVAAASATGDGAGTDGDVWQAVDLTADDATWRVTVAGPGPDAPGRVGVVLAGRSSGARLALAVKARDDTLVAEVPRRDLAVFGPEVVDLWVHDDAGDGVRRRVSCAELGAGPLDGAGTDGATWYATKHGNLSVRLAPPVGSSRLRPTLTGARFVDDAWRLLVDGAGVRRGARLVARGRQRTKIAVSVPLRSGSPGWEATVTTEQLRPFGGEVVDLFVADEGETGDAVRVAADDVPVAVASADSRTPYATRKNMASLRRKTAAEVIRDAGAFDDAHYRAQGPDLAPDEDPVDHYVRVGAAQGLDPSTMFDTTYYWRANPDVRAVNPFAHYCEFGWKELRNPSPQFDTWWYWSKHLTLPDESVAPLTHYEQVGRSANLSTRPERFPSRRFGTGQVLPTDRPVRRVCLFAAYDVDGIVDDYVVDYVRELSRFADVYYLADSAMAASELAKLEGVTKGAWAQPHGEYDFGSYKRLAERVGWDVLETYDELLLVNDSCYLLRPLDEVFARMDARPADWWGLQASTRKHASWDPHRAPISRDALDVLVDRVEPKQTDHVHVSSYFAAFRAPVIRDPEFRRYLGTVRRQSVKSNVILRYEIGLSRWLVTHGHRFDTFAGDVYPYHPVYNGWYFRLLDQGFPLLKRQLLSTNPFRVKDLASWKQRILAKVPDAQVDLFERNLRRVVDPAALRATVDDVSAVPDRTEPETPADLLTDDEFRVADRRTVRRPELWVFPVDPTTQELTGNVRAVFEQVRQEPTIRKVVLRRDTPIDLDGANVEVVDLASPAGQERLLQAGTVLVDVDLRSEVIYPVSGEFHNIIRLGSSGRDKRLEVADGENPADDARYRALLSSSKVETLALTAASYPMTFHQVWNTGSPRTDFILGDEANLPADLAAELSDVRATLAGRWLLLLVTDDDLERDHGLSSEERARIGEWFVQHGCVLGIRSRRLPGSLPASSPEGIPFLDLSGVTHPEVLYREATALLTDVSGSFVDFLVTGRPVLTFVPDVAPVSRRRVADLEDVFPGAVTRTFDELWAALDGLLTAQTDATYTFKRRLFHDHLDGASAARAVEKIRDLTEVYGVGKPFGERMA